MAFRTQVDAAEWAAPGYEPPNAQYAELMSKMARNREIVSGVDRVTIADGATFAEVPFESYWPEIEDVALEHLLLFERGAGSRDTQLSPAFDDRFHEVRALIRAGNLIGAIKLYREKTGVGLKEAKDAVEAMR
jgi:hypothetical protein